MSIPVLGIIIVLVATLGAALAAVPVVLRMKALRISLADAAGDLRPGLDALSGEAERAAEAAERLSSRLETAHKNSLDPEWEFCRDEAAPSY